MNITLDDNKRLFLISDLHLMHDNIRKYANRPFDNVQIMTETLINNWNNIVNENDQIIFLGDFVVGTDNPIEKSKYLFDCLNGIKYFIIGNHDEQKLRTDMPWYRGPILTTYRGHKLKLQHYPFKKDELINEYKHFHGHNHSHTLIHEDINIINVSCEAINYTPILFEDCLREK